MPTPDDKIDPKKSLQGYRIVVVDDEPDLAEVVSFNFEEMGAIVSTFNGGYAALEHARHHKVDLVISDIRMTEGDGAFLIKSIQELPDEIRPRLYFMTGYTDFKVEETLDMGAMGVVGKPMRRNQFLDLVRHIVLPPIERWDPKAQAPAEVIAQIRRKYTSLENANAKKKLSFGKGGFFLALEHDVPAISEQIAFHIQFEEGAIKNIEGIGIIRWARLEDVEGPMGYGVEIKSIIDTDRPAVVAYLKSLTTRSFIPRLAF